MAGEKLPISESDRREIASTRVTDVLAFYERRGYASTGRGKTPAVLVIDFSIAFTRGMPDFPTTGFDPQVEATAALLAAVRGRVPIYYTTIAYEPDMADAGLWAVKIPWLHALKAGVPEVEIDPRLDPQPTEPVIVKKYASSFFGTDLDRRLREDGVDTLIITGCTTSVCVRATTVDSMQHGYRTILAADGVGDYNPALHALHLADLGARYADVLSMREVTEYAAASRG